MKYGNIPERRYYLSPAKFDALVRTMLKNSGAELEGTASNQKAFINMVRTMVSAASDQGMDEYSAVTTRREKGKK